MDHMVGVPHCDCGECIGGRMGAQSEVQAVVRPRRFEAWAGIGWPEGWNEVLGVNGSGLVVWPIVDVEEYAVIQGYPRPDQWFAVAFSPEAQSAIVNALNNSVV